MDEHFEEKVKRKSKKQITVLNEEVVENFEVPQKIEKSYKLNEYINFESLRKEKSNVEVPEKGRSIRF